MAAEKRILKEANDHCGQCAEFVCPTLHAFAYDPQQGDGGKRLENRKARMIRE